MGIFDEGLERVLCTRPVPSGIAAGLSFLLRTQKGSTRRVAALLGVSRRSVQRWVAADPGARRPPGVGSARVIEDVVRARWQPRVRARVRAEAEARGLVLHARARFGFESPAGSSDDPRVRLITGRLSGAFVRELFAARDAGADEYGQMLVVARALGHSYFRDGGDRAEGLRITFSDVEFVEFVVG